MFGFDFREVSFFDIFQFQVKTRSGPEPDPDQNQIWTRTRNQKPESTKAEPCRGVVGHFHLSILRSEGRSELASPRRTWLNLSVLTW